MTGFAHLEVFYHVLSAHAVKRDSIFMTSSLAGVVCATSRSKDKSRIHEVLGVSFGLVWRGQGRKYLEAQHRIKCTIH